MASAKLMEMLHEIKTGKLFHLFDYSFVKYDQNQPH